MADSRNFRGVCRHGGQSQVGGEEGWMCGRMRCENLQGVRRSEAGKGLRGSDVITSSSATYFSLYASS